jgi:Domain of unknown function (DUF5642)
MFKVVSAVTGVAAVAGACALAGCSPGGHASGASGVSGASPPKADITKVADVKSSFGPDFKLTDIARRPVDEAFFSDRKLPAGLTFDPPECGKVVLAPPAPEGVEGSMTGVSADGDGNRFVVVAVHATPAVPLNDPGHHCAVVTFTAPHVKGSIETVDAPEIQGAQTLGVHRVVQALNDDAKHTTELYRYSAQFGDYNVFVVATPLADADQPAAQVDTDRARDLLAKAVAAVRG